MDAAKNAALTTRKMKSVMGSHLHEDGERHARLALDEVRAPRHVAGGIGDLRAGRALVAAGWRHAAGAREVRDARVAIHEFAAERDELARHEVEAELGVPRDER